MGIGLPEIIIVIVAAAILLFGGKKIIDLSRSMGRASGEFKKAKRDVERELNSEESAEAERTVAPTTEPVQSTPMQPDAPAQNPERNQ